MAKVFGPSGVKGIDVQTPTGTRSYNADKSGLIEISNKSDLKQAVSEGMAVAGLASGFAVEGFPCECGFQSVFVICGKCGKDNG